ncbi:hypothetical protein GOBAR_AA28787 [Gossypium barbadense]|uniref:Uncharacterized protein n=1 Tax=Gossypium barbadense TaxID=3634 RepID=A0A2P5WLH0_GOSBA|nr:hypothetical protein GOBAR_AA28787 [Gossypium barbadense]
MNIARILHIEEKIIPDISIGLEKDINEKGIRGATILRLSGSMILVVFESVEMLEFVKPNQWDILDSCCMHKQWWSDKIKVESRRVWLAYMNSSMDTFSGNKEAGTKEVDRILQAVKNLVLSVGANEEKGDDDRILNVLGLLRLYGRGVNLYQLWQPFMPLRT